MLVQTKRTDVSTQIQNMYNECVRYERLSRSPKFRQLDTHHEDTVPHIIITTC